MKRYTSSLDTFAKCAPLFIIALAVFIVVKDTDGININGTGIHLPNMAALRFSTIFTTILLPGIVIAMYLLMTKSILVDDYTITVERSIRSVIINISDISSIKRVPDMKFTLRTFGNGGVFGYTGKYYKKSIGSMTWYCTQRKNYILIEKTNGKKLVITPDDPDGFLNDIAAKHPSLVA